MSPLRTLSSRVDILSTVNERAQTEHITVQGQGWTDEVRSLSGTRLEHPVVYTRDDRRFEISWALAERLATSQSNRIIH